LLTGHGMIALLGSGETSLAGGRVFEALAQQLPHPLKIAILETPAGFELNSPQVAQRVADFLLSRLQNHSPQVTVVPARKRGTPDSPDEPSSLEGLFHAGMIFMGPGSPTYAVRQLKGSLAWDILRERHRQGAALVFSSAATIAVGGRVLPVYEIFKVGEDITAPPGLDLFSDFGLELSCIPHWNNTDGGSDVDTSRCFVGMERFAEWRRLLPPAHTTIGLDEHTALVMDFAAGACRVSGISSVSILGACNPVIHPAGSAFPLADLGHVSHPPENGIRSQVRELLQAAGGVDAQSVVPPEVQEMLRLRQEARQRRDWSASDRLRDGIAARGWLVQDTPDGQQLVRA